MYTAARTACPDQVLVLTVQDDLGWRSFEMARWFLPQILSKARRAAWGMAGVMKSVGVVRKYDLTLARVSLC